MVLYPVCREQTGGTWLGHFPSRTNGVETSPFVEGVLKIERGSELGVGTWRAVPVVYVNNNEKLLNEKALYLILTAL